MKKQKYSESKIETAQKFLSEYDLSFDSLNEVQQRIIVNYTYSRKYYLLCLVLFIFGMIVFSSGAYIVFQTTGSGIDELIKMSILENIDSLCLYGKIYFKSGLVCGLYIFGAFFMLANIIFISTCLQAKFQMLNTFLPAIKYIPDNDKTSNY